MIPVRLPLLLLLISATTLADAQRPRVAVHPLVLEGVDSKKDRDDLTALLPGIVIAQGKVEIASPSDVDAELKKKGQAFCSAENLFKCLSYIAEHTSSVHALRIELRRGGRAGEWELLANVIRVDGVVERQTEVFKFNQPEGVKLVPVARSRLEEFVASLKLSTLPLAPPVQAAAEPVAATPKTDIPKADIPTLVQPLPPDHSESTSPKRTAALIFGGVAIVALGASAGLAISTGLDANALAPHIDRGSVEAGYLKVAQDIDTKNSAALGCLVVGALAASTAVTLYVLSREPDRPSIVTAAPIPGGGAVTFSSRF